MQSSASKQPSRTPAPATSGGVVEPGDRPEWVRDATSLPHASYADVFMVETADEATPEQWARAMFGDVPLPGEIVIWRGMLGLRLSKGKSSSTVAGWRIGARGDDWIRLEAKSWFLSANLIVRQQGRQVSLATLVNYDRFLARLLWPVLSNVHRLLVPRVLSHAVSKIAHA